MIHQRARRDQPDGQPDDLLGGADTMEPWARYGWGMGAVWIVFLVYPVLAVLGSERPAWVIGTGLAGLALFGATYVHGVRVAFREPFGAHRSRVGLVHAGLLSLIALLLVPVAGIGTLGTVTFIVTTLIFSQPLAWGMATTLAAAALGLVAPLGWGEPSQAGIYTPLILLVGVICLAIRAINLRQAAHEELTDRLAVIGERERVARDVHDVLGHSLTVISLKADLATRLLDADPERARAELTELQALARTSLAEVRSTVTGLRQARLEQERDAAVTALASAGIEAHLPDDPGVVDAAHHATIAWALREAVTNVVRHAHARRVEVDWGATWLEVRDDGRGVGGQREGNGLRGLRERVAADGGHLLLADGVSTPGVSTPGERDAPGWSDSRRRDRRPGTRLRVDLPARGAR